jgi:hypothetical protein
MKTLSPLQFLKIKSKRNWKLVAIFGLNWPFKCCMTAASVTLPPRPTSHSQRGFIFKRKSKWEPSVKWSDQFLKIQQLLNPNKPSLNLFWAIGQGYTYIYPTLINFTYWMKCQQWWMNFIYDGWKMNFSRSNSESSTCVDLNSWYFSLVQRIDFSIRQLPLHFGREIEVVNVFVWLNVLHAYLWNPLY